MNIRIGVPLVAEDGTAGRVERIILHPASQEIAGVVVAQGGVLHRDVVVPSERLLAADDNGLRVRGNLAEINELEGFSASQYVDPPQDWMPPTDTPGGVYLFPDSPLTVGAFERPVTQPQPPDHLFDTLQAGDVEVSGATTVFCGTRSIGHVERVVTDGDSDHVTHLVVRRGAMFGREVAVPVAEIASIGERGIELALAEEELDSLPAFTG